MFSENASDFIDTDEFALTGTYDGSTPVNGHFDNAYADEFGVAGTTPAFLCAAADVPIGGIGKTFAVSGVTYRIRNRQPQDDGLFVLLKLEKQ
jgi:hypothetical protein